MASSETDERGRHSGPGIIEQREQYWNLMNRTRKAATHARKVLAVKTEIVVPESITLQGADAWQSRLPHTLTVPQRARQKLIAKKLDLKRPQTSGGRNASGVASRIEQPLMAIMKDRKAGFPWADVNDLVLLEGLAFSTTLTLWEGNTLATALYGADGQIERRFSGDKSGRLRGDDGYDESTVDLDAARRQAITEQHEVQAQNIPFRQRAHSIRQCAPIWNGSMELTGLIVETHWTSADLKRRKVRVSSDTSGSNLYPLGAIGEGDQGNSGGGTPIKVTEMWAYDDDGLPYLSYCVDGKPTWQERDGELVPHIIDLSNVGKGDKKSGLTRLPVSWGWGLGWSAADLDERAMSFIAPYWQSWRNIDSLLTAIITWAQWRGMPGLIEELPFNTPDDGLDDDEPDAPDIQPGKITRVRGKITEIATQGIAPGVFNVISLMLGENKAEGPGGAGQDATSGFGMSLSAAFEQDAMTTVHDAVRGMYEDNASFVLEGCKVVGEVSEPVRVFQIADVILESKNPSATDAILVLEPDLIGRSFTVKAITKIIPGENPAVRQQNADLVERRLMPKAKFLELDGDPSPEATLNEIFAEDLLDSDPGKAFQLRLLEQYTNDEYIRQITDAIANKDANPQGLPMGAGYGVPPPPADVAAMAQQGPGVGAPVSGAGMDGMTVPNPIANSLSATVAAPLQNGPIQRAVNAGGAMPNAPLPTGVQP